MTHDLPQERAKLMLSKIYSASPGFLQAVCWQPDSSGHVLVDKKSTGGHTVVAVVGPVLGWETELFPAWELREPEARFPAYRRAKFQLRLMKPRKPPLSLPISMRPWAVSRRSKRRWCLRRTTAIFCYCGEGLWHGQRRKRPGICAFARNVFEKRVRLFNIQRVPPQFFTAVDSSLGKSKSRPLVRRVIVVCRGVLVLFVALNL